MIYKYLDEETLQPVQDRTLKFAKTEDLNDPFESLMMVEVREIRPEEVPSLLDKMGLPGVRDIDFEPKQLEEIALKINETLKGSRNETKHSLGSILNQIKVRETVEAAVGFGALSLSKNPKSSLMWSHYCKKHKGYVLGFDEAHDFFQRGEKESYRFGQINPVKYSEERSIAGFRAGQDGSFEYRFRKSIDWSYEEEVRMLMPLRSCTEISPSLHVLEYPKEALKRVIFGFYCHPVTVDKIKTSLSESKVEYLRAVPSSVSFDMELMPEEEFFIDHDGYMQAVRDKFKPELDKIIEEHTKK